MLAWRISTGVAVLSAASFGGAFALLFSGAASELRLVLFLGGAAAVVAGVIFGHLALLRLTGQPGERILLETFFPMVMSLVPVAGPFIALWRVVKLLRGRLDEATVTTTSGKSMRSRHYSAEAIGRAGVPVALCLLVLVCLQPLIGLRIYGAAAKRGEPATPPTVERPEPRPSEAEDPSDPEDEPAAPR
jgi:hypothetical protein